ncbi:hypothetical protein Phum_PHUM424340 [Pediculus humanus corporis]|uniref:Uncharacterized protein n=1 Tax=Pediculus humanus subsp. corporis TaxID=121224 RepID=E0VSX1_PEDHC|nr:uncharacterized protein Phum_PHUM424340 [Pediculus humanus corporis]EEB16477.1 hypothetical protein Phum_PHUM424340 [Pediculus humanus corporis]
MESKNMTNGTNSNEVQSPPVNFILGDEPEITVEGPPEDFSKEDEHHDEKADSFPSGLKSNSFDSGSGGSLNYAFGLGEQKKRLR